jgi:hypothetical protein
MDFMSLGWRWMHVVPAVLLAGGIFFYRACLVDPNRDGSLFDQNDQARRRWMMLVGICTLFLTLSGCYNFYAKLMEYRLGGLYHGLFGIKFLLGMASFYLASVLAGRSDRARRFRQKERFWLNLLSTLLVGAILIGGFLKVSSTSAPKKVKSEARAGEFAPGIPFENRF